MQVKLLTNLGKNQFPDTPYQEGEQHEVSDQLGAILLRRSLAVEITPEPSKKPEPVIESPAPVVVDTAKEPVKKSTK